VLGGWTCGRRPSNQNWFGTATTSRWTTNLQSKGNGFAYFVALGKRRYWRWPGLYFMNGERRQAG
jgi:hypothetical protein